MGKVCCFIGHRNVENKEIVEKTLYDVIEDLILNHNVSMFLFGSKGEFYGLCLDVFAKIREKYEFVENVAYKCRHEWCSLVGDGQAEDKKYIFNSEKEFKSKWVAGRASYVERNFEMIDDSDFCVFYYVENYKPTMRKYSKGSLSYYQQTSGTKVAYEYANKKKKNVINIQAIMSGVGE